MEEESVKRKNKRTTLNRGHSNIGKSGRGGEAAKHLEKGLSEAEGKLEACCATTKPKEERADGS